MAAHNPNIFVSRLTRTQAEDFYAEHRERKFFE